MQPNWSTACLDWGPRLIRGDSIIPPPIFPEEAERALAIFKELRIVDAPGSPTFGESCAPWVFDLVSSIFGAYDSKSGRRLITEWFICLPKKNSKSTISAGIMMTSLILNWRQSAEYTVLAPTVEVANNAFGPARDMVRVDEDLDALMHVQTHIKCITHRDSHASLKILAADSDTVGGKKSVGTLVDELHLFGKKSDAENMMREALGGLASRPEGFVIYLTTQSDEAPSGIFRQKLQYARDVRDGVIEDKRFVPIIFEHPKEMVDSGAHLLMENLAIVNPNLGYSVDNEFLEREYTKAKSAGTDSFIGFMAKHANVEIGMALRADKWAGAEFWEQNGDSVTLEQLMEQSEVVTAGIDGGGLDDLLALALVGRREDGTWLHWARAWAHPIVLQRRKSEAARFRDFAKDGDLVIVDAVGQDVREVADIIKRVDDAGVLDKIGVDPAGIGSVVDAITDEGIDHERVVGIPQGWKLTGAIKTTERRLAEGAMRHGGRPYMAWTVGNAKVEQRGNALVITKQTAGSAKIDGLMATFDAVALMAMNPKARKRQHQLFFV